MDTSYQEKLSGVTRVKTLSLTYDWTIYNIGLSGKRIGEFIRSPIFSSSKSNDYQWFLELYPAGSDEESKNHLSLYLYLHSQKNPCIDVAYNFSCINSKKDSTKGSIFYKANARSYFSEEDNCWGFPKFLKHDDFAKILSIGKFIIQCHLTAGIKIENCHIDNIPFKTDSSKNLLKIYNELEVLLQSKDFSDVTLIASGKEFHVHKAILGTRSPVFLAMLKHDMKEKAENKIEITDCDSDVLNEMLRYIYTGKVNNIEKYSRDLLFIAEKYALNGLKVICQKFIYSTISTINAVEILILADQYNCERLKILDIHFIIAHRKDIFESSQFKMLKDSNSKLMFDLCSIMALKNT